MNINLTLNWKSKGKNVAQLDIIVLIFTSKMWKVKAGKWKWETHTFAPIYSPFPSRYTFVILWWCDFLFQNSRCNIFIIVGEKLKWKLGVIYNKKIQHSLYPDIIVGENCKMKVISDSKIQDSLSLYIIVGKESKWKL